MRKTLSVAVFSGVSRISVVAGLGLALAGCSSDFSRIGEGPSSTGGTSNQQAILGGGGGVQPHAAPLQPYPGDVTGSVSQTALPPMPPAQPYAAAPAPLAANQPIRQAPAAPAGWSTTQGTWVTMAPGETVDTLSRRYSVPSSAILSANNIADANRPMTGQRVLIPTYSANAPAAVAPAQPMRSAAVAPAGATPRLVPGAAPMSTAPKAAAVPVTTAPKVASIAPAAPPLPAMTPAKVPAQAGVNIGPHVVKKGETLATIASSYGTTPAKLKGVNGLTSDNLQIGQKLTLPSGVVLKVAQNTPAPAAAIAPPISSAPAVAPAAAPGAPVIASNAPGKATSPAIVESKLDSAAIVQEPKKSELSFRWPVRGRVITEFGSKTGGERNDGINLAVPEGTSVKAAEDGTVIYADNKISGYGNLVLVQHADGFVSAYAHASNMMVRKGEKVTRGQIIANAGTTGSVSQPQLHFELRKGGQPVDPTQYLAN